MRLVSDELVEFRMRRESSGQNGTNYYYYFEDGSMAPFQLWSKRKLDLEKGCMYTLVFTTRLWDNQLQFNLEEVIPSGGK